MSLISDLFGWPVKTTPLIPYGTFIVDIYNGVIYHGKSETPIYDQMAKERGL